MNHSKFGGFKNMSDFSIKFWSVAWYITAATQENVALGVCQVKIQISLRIRTV